MKTFFFKVWILSVICIVSVVVAEAATITERGPHHRVVQEVNGDGQTNIEEYWAGTDPNSRESNLRIERFARTLPAGTKIEFTAISKRTYAVEFRDESPAGQWRVLAEFTATATNRIIEHIDSTAPNGRRFYRLVTPRLP